MNIVIDLTGTSFQIKSTPTGFEVSTRMDNETISTESYSTKAEAVKALKESMNVLLDPINLMEGSFL